MVRRYIIYWVVIFVGISISNADDFHLQQQQIKNKRVVVASVHLKNGDPTLQLFWKDDSGQPLKSFEALNAWLKGKKRKLLFATNSGTYRDTPSLAPIGLHVENGKKLTRVNFANNCGNFCWYSGVFHVENNHPYVLRREDVGDKDFSHSRFALQSGPFLIRAGAMQGTWSNASYNLSRSAICTTKETDQVVISLVIEPTNFAEFFAILKEIGCHDGLFLDGNVSSFYDGKTGNTVGNPFESYAGILAVTESATSR